MTTTVADEKIYCLTQSQIDEIKQQGAREALDLFEKRFLEHEDRVAAS